MIRSSTSEGLRNDKMWFRFDFAAKFVASALGAPMRGHTLLIAAAAALTVSPASAQLFGLGKFKVEQTNDRFSTDGLATYVGRNNRISKKSVAGGTHIDGTGMFVEPRVSRRKADGSLVSVGFFIHNETERSSTYGNANGIGIPQRIIFILDGGQPISVAITNGSSTSSDYVSYNSISGSASMAIQESGFADLTAEQFRRIAGAGTIAVKIQGSERDAVYNERDISKSFMANLKAFDAMYVSATTARTP